MRTGEQSAPLLDQDGSSRPASGCPTFIVAISTTSLSNGGDRVLRLVRALRRRGARLEILTLAAGPDSGPFEAQAPVTIVQNLPTPTISALSSVAGGRARQAARGVGLRRWLRRRHGSALVIGDPAAAPVMRYDRVGRPSVAMLPSRSARSVAEVIESQSDFAGVRGWLTCSDEQKHWVQRTFGHPAIITGPLLDSADLPTTSEGSQGTVVLLPDPGVWFGVDHAAEVAVRLSEMSTAVRWAVDGREDEWLARHDIRHLGVRGRIAVMDSTDPAALEGVSLVIRTGYSEIDSPVVVAARRDGVPVLGFSSETSSGVASAAPFDVEGLVEQVASYLIPDSGANSRVPAEPGYGQDPDDVVTTILKWVG